MVFLFFQMSGAFQTGLYFGVLIGFIIGLIMLKIGLVITKADVRNSFKWVLASFGIQVGMFFFVASPLIIMGLSGAFDEGGPAVVLIIIFLILALFIDLHLLNVLHQLGFKKALLVFGLMAIPFVFVSFSVVALIIMFVFD